MAAIALIGSFMVVVAILYNQSRKFRFYLKMFVFAVLSVISATIFMPFMFFRPKDTRNALLPCWGFRLTAKILGLDYKVIGRENITEGGGVVLMNHQSYIDIFMLGELWPLLKGKCTIISKRQIFYLWPFGLACWLWGTVFIDRSRAQDAQDAVNKAASTVIMSRKSKILMFPEGTRHGGETLLPFKKGGFHIAVECQVKIQPVVASQYQFLDTKSATFNSGTVVVSILPPIDTKGLTKEDIPSLMNRTYKIMTEEYNRISGFSKTPNVQT